MLEQEVDFINEDESLLTLSTVLCDSVQNRVKDDKPMGLTNLPDIISIFMNSFPWTI